MHQTRGWRSERDGQEVFDHLGGDHAVHGRARGWAQGVVVVELVDHGQLEEIGPHAMALLEQFQHAAAAGMQQVGEAGALGGTMWVAPRNRAICSPRESCSLCTATKPWGSSRASTASSLATRRVGTPFRER